MEKVKFNYLFNFLKKSNLNASDEDKNGKYPFYTSSNSVNRRTNNPLYNQVALVIGNGGTANIHYADTPFSTTSHCYIAIQKRNDINIKYVYYYLSTNLHLLERGFKGVGLKNISSKYIEAIEIPFPDIETQDKIVAVLDRAKGILDKREEAIRKYDKLLSAIFLEMFGDPYFNSKKWKTGKLEDYLECIADIGSNGSNETVVKNLKMLDEPDYAIMVRTLNLSNNDFKINVKYISEETYNFFKKSKIYGGEIIMNKIGSAGEFWMMPYLNKPVSLGLNQLVIRTKNMNIKYLFYFLSTEYGKTLIKSKTRGAATKSITKTAIKEFELNIPPIELQDEFAKITDKIDAIKEKLFDQLENTQFLLNAVSQLSFKGDLSFNAATDLEVLLEKDYKFFKENYNTKSLQLLLERIDKNELNENKFHDKETYDKAKSFVFELLKENKIKQIFDKKTQVVKLAI